MSRSLNKQASVPGRRPVDTQPTDGWTRVMDSIKLGTLRFVGLEPTSEERRHWDALQSTIHTRKQAKSSLVQRLPSDQPQSIRRSIVPREAAALKHITGRMIHVEPTSAKQPQSPAMRAGGPASPYPVPVGPPSPGVHTSLYNKRTGRNVAIKTELKPDLWKVAYQSIRQLSLPKGTEAVPTGKPMSFFGLEDVEDEHIEKGVDQPDGAPVSPVSLYPIKEEVHDEDFFGEEETSLPEDMFQSGEGFDETDSAPLSGPPVAERIRPKYDRQISVKERRSRINIKDMTLSGGYRKGYGGLGLPTLLLRFKYKFITKEDQDRLDQQLLHKRPYFTYWLMTVQLLIMVVALAVYGFAPYGWDLINVREPIQQPEGGFAVVSKDVVPNVWGGPPQQALVILGALYGPCMRRDADLFEGIEADRQRENSSSGCCMRLDGGGCFQTQEDNCSPRFNDFISTSQNIRAVCGTSPSTCSNPDPDRLPDDTWVFSDLLTWPICTNNVLSSEPHLKCEVTGRPCCYGIQAICVITTREVCNFYRGQFHQDAFLCSQVDCLNGVCGLLPFREFNQPDQIYYRLWTSIFLHAGLIHLCFSLFFDFFILRHVEKRLGWWRTAFIFILSGVGANMVSAYFVPYYPEVGPAGSILGIVAYFFVFLIFESPRLERPWLEAIKLFVCVLLPLFLVGLLPFIDNFAHIGGLVFGFLLSGIIVPYWKEKEAWDDISYDNTTAARNSALPRVKMVLIVVGIPLVILLFLLFILLFYFLQSTWIGFSFLNCVPFTSSFCIDSQQFIRNRTATIV